jgi:hypothetical protein
MSDKTTRRGRNVLVKKRDDGTKVKIKLTKRGVGKEVTKGPEGKSKIKVKVDDKGAKKLKFNTTKTVPETIDTAGRLSQAASDKSSSSKKPKSLKKLKKRG